MYIYEPSLLPCEKYQKKIRKNRIFYITEILCIVFNFSQLKFNRFKKYRKIYIISINKDDKIHKQRSSKNSDLYLNQWPRKSRFPLNLTDRQTYRHTDGHTDVIRTDICFYRVALLQKKNSQNLTIHYSQSFTLVQGTLYIKLFWQCSNDKLTIKLNIHYLKAQSSSFSGRSSAPNSFSPSVPEIIK